ncbi:hypothetical protein, partial [Nitrosomonas supralitoralis]
IVAMMAFSFTCAFSQEQPIEKPAQITKAEGKNELGSAKGHSNKILSTSSPLTAPPIESPKTTGLEETISQTNHDGELKNVKKEEGWFSKLLADPIAFFTFLLFLATVALWWATRRLVQGAEDTAQRQLRAYVSINLDEKMFFDSDGLLNAPFITKNNGVTPANFMLCSLHIGLFRFPLDTELDPPNYSPTSSNSSLFPGEQVRQYATLPRELNQTETQVIENGEGAIYVWGEVRYKDVFNKQRSTQFRMYSTGADFCRGELAYHHEGNVAE